MFERVPCNAKQSSSEPMQLNTFVSPAWRVVVTIASDALGRSLMKIVKSSGPTRLPCGRLDVTGAQIYPDLTLVLGIYHVSSRDIIILNTL